MKHDHTECEHIIAYCAKCDACYCTKCEKEWKAPVALKFGMGISGVKVDAVPYHESAPALPRPIPWVQPQAPSWGPLKVICHTSASPEQQREFTRQSSSIADPQPTGMTVCKHT